MKFFIEIKFGISGYKSVHYASYCTNFKSNCYIGGRHILVFVDNWIVEIEMRQICTIFTAANKNESSKFIFFCSLNGNKRNLHYVMHDAIIYIEFIFVKQFLRFRRKNAEKKTWLGGKNKNSP